MELKNCSREVSKENDQEGHDVWLINGMTDIEIL